MATPRYPHFAAVARQTRRLMGRLRLAVLALMLVVAALSAASAGATALPSGFQQSTVFSGLSNPTALRLASDGRVFVATKSGRIYVYNSITDPTRTLFADLSTNVDDYWDRGLLGLALDPQFPARPYVYVLYTYDHVLGDSSPPPKWGDACPTPPGPTTDGCVASGRLSRLTAAGSTMTGSEQVLIEDWCQQFPSHSIGSLAFAPDGSLYVTGGEGASFDYADYGQTGNPCGDPPGPAGSNLSPPTAEGGALRSQDILSTADPTGLNGAVLRVDPDTGQGVAGNPYAASTDANARRIVAYGLRNPFRAVVRPDTSELWIGDVGWGKWEEIDRLADPTQGANFGWPCYEGAARQSSYDSLNVNLCEGLYSAGSGVVVAPRFAYNHSATVAGTGDPCPTGSSAIAGLAFGTSATIYPVPFDRALFFADHERDCIWAMPLGADGLPDPGAVRTFATGLTTGPVDLVIGPGGDLYYAGYDSGTIQRISYTAANQAPVAVAKATPTSGSTPLTVQFDGTGSSDPDPGDTLSYAWDLDGDGAYDDSTAAQPSWTYQTDGIYTARLRVTDSHGASATDSVTITAGNSPPTATITTPISNVQWSVGEVIGFAGSATDPQDGTLPASALSWDLILHHCPSNCHEHYIQGFSGATGSFTAPDHEYPSYLELRLTVTDSGGLKDTQTVRLDPKTVNLTLASSPFSGLDLTLNAVSAKANFTQTVIQNSSNSISAPDQGQFLFRSWSDGGAQTHQIQASNSATYTATFTTYRRTILTTPGLVSYWRLDESSGTSALDQKSRNPGTYRGGYALRRPGALVGDPNTAAAFDGTSGEMVADGPSLSTSGSLEGWFNWQGGIAVMCDNTSWGAGWILAYDRGGSLYYRIAGKSFNTGRTAASVRNGWHYIAIAKYAGSVAFYLDGKLVHYGTGVADTATVMPWHLMRTGTTSLFAMGVADEVAAYNVALSGSTIAAHYSTGKGD